MISDEKIEKLLSDAAKATPGPWHRNDAIATIIYDVRGWPIANAVVFHTHGPAGPADNASHVANCDPETITDMCEELKRLRAKETGK